MQSVGGRKGGGEGNVAGFVVWGVAGFMVLGSAPRKREE